MKHNVLKDAVNEAKAFRAVVEDNLRAQLKPQILKEADARIKAQVARMLEAEDEEEETPEEDEGQDTESTKDDIDVDVVPVEGDNEEGVEDEPTEDDENNDDEDEDKDAVNEVFGDMDDDIDLEDDDLDLGDDMDDDMGMDDDIDVDLPTTDYGYGDSDMDDLGVVTDDDDMDFGPSLDTGEVDLDGGLDLDDDDMDDDMGMDDDDEYPMESRRMRGKAVNESLILRKKLAEQRKVNKVLLQTINETRLAMQKHNLITRIYNWCPTLSTNQRVRIAEQFDKAHDVNTAKVIYRVIKEQLSISQKVSKRMTSPRKTTVKPKAESRVMPTGKSTLNENKIPQAKRWSELVHYNSKKNN